MTPDNIKNVDGDKWADYCADYPTYASQLIFWELAPAGYIDSLVIRHKTTQEFIGMVDYFANGQREYWIFQKPKGEKLTIEISPDGTIKRN